MSYSEQNAIDYDDGTVLSVGQFVRLKANLPGEDPKYFHPGATVMVTDVRAAWATPPKHNEIFPATVLYKLQATEVTKKMVPEEQPIKQKPCPHVQLSPQGDSGYSKSLYQDGQSVYLTKKFEYLHQGRVQTLEKGTIVQIAGNAISATGRTVARDVKGAHYAIKQCHLQDVPETISTKGRFQRGIFHTTPPRPE